MTFSISIWIHILALLFSFFVLGALIGAIFYEPAREKLIKLLHLEHVRKLLCLDRSIHNPIMRPGSRPWTGEAVLNPAAIILGGRTHLIYRAIGTDGVSRLGYASSKDGIFFDDLVPYPVFVAHDATRSISQLRRYSPVMYPSGGSWGGCEDPRMVTINGRVYVTFNTFENWVLRVAYISLSEEDFLAKRFDRWDGPHVLSHSRRDKNWVLFPEKINGSFAVLHSIISNGDDKVLIEYTDDLETLSERDFESTDPQKIPDHRVEWHDHVRSAGPPPIKTEEGWLVLYHANDVEEPWKYKLGAMLLDLNDPTKIIKRAIAPVLVPDEHYENNGKPGIVYACGATVRGGKLHVYYGGADKVICVATTPIEKFVQAILEDEQPAIDENSATQTS